MTHAGERVAVTTLRAERKLPGTDLFCQYHRVVNLPGLSCIWVGRVKPDAAPGSTPDYETLEQAWLLDGEEYYSLDEAIAAWHAKREREDLRDRVAEAVRRMLYGLIRPLWHDMKDIDRERWRERADALLRLFRSFGLTITSSAREATDDRRQD